MGTCAGVHMLHEGFSWSPCNTRYFFTEPIYILFQPHQRQPVNKTAQINPVVGLWLHSQIFSWHESSLYGLSPLFKVFLKHHIDADACLFESFYVSLYYADFEVAEGEWLLKAHTTYWALPCCPFFWTLRSWHRGSLVKLSKELSGSSRRRQLWLMLMQPK